MRRTFLILGLALPISLAFGQTDSNSITVTSSLSTTTGVPPDQAVFTVQVNSGLDVSLDEVTTALAGSGVTSSNFVALNSFLLIPQPPAPLPSMLGWTFRFATPLAKVTETLARLASLQQSMAKKNNGLTLTFQLQGTQVSGQNCSLSDLIANSRSQAQKLADAGGVSLGNILAISNPAGTSSVNAIQAAPLGASTSPPSGPLACAVTVKFALLRY